MPNKPMNPGEVVLHVFGQTLAAKICGLDRASVWRWSKRGLVPANHHVTLLEGAKQHGLRLTPKDLVLGRD